MRLGARVEAIEFPRRGSFGLVEAFVLAGGASYGLYHSGVFSGLPHAVGLFVGLATPVARGGGHSFLGSTVSYLREEALSVQLRALWGSQ